MHIRLLLALALTVLAFAGLTRTDFLSTGKDVLASSAEVTTAAPERYDVTPDMPLSILPRTGDKDDKIHGAKVVEHGHETLLECPDGTVSIDLHGGDVIAPDGTRIDRDQSVYPPYSDNPNDAQDFSLTFSHIAPNFRPQLLIIGNRTATTQTLRPAVYDDQAVDLTWLDFKEDGPIILPKVVYTFGDPDQSLIEPKYLCAAA